MQIGVYIIIGFFAQLIDGTLGMAYGVSCRTFLKTFAHVPTNLISAVVHYAEIPTSFTSMISHIRLRNVNKKMLIRLISTGIIGSVLGAYLIVFNMHWIELFVDIYLVIMGVVVLSKGFNHKWKNRFNNNRFYQYFLGFIGAFFDASGGGGWGPIVTGSLLVDSDDPKKIIGTVNASEFFVTLASSVTFMLLITNIKEYFFVIIGLIIGGMIAAPFAARLCLKIDNKNLYIMTGLMLILLNVYNVITFF